MDLDVVRSVLADAWTKYQSAYPDRKPPNRGDAFLRAVVAETSRGQRAMEAIRRTKPLANEQVDALNTVLDGRSLWANYLALKPSAQTALVRNVAWLTGALASADDDVIGAAVLEECWKRSETDLRVAFGSHASDTFLRTRALRFWASMPEVSRPREPAQLVRRLGIMGFARGTWLVEVVYDRKQIEGILGGEVASFVRRPSALCPNDVSTPRFRALRPHEVDSYDRGEELDACGHTVDLNDWHESKTIERLGLLEVMCPAVQWRPDLLPTQILLLGQIDSETAIPGNESFADFLRDSLRISPEKEDLVLGIILAGEPLK